MGQGTESCGGYDAVYDPHEYDESKGFTVWSGKDGDYDVSSMSASHIKNCIRLCERKAATESFSHDSDKWQEWIDVFEIELLGKSDVEIKEKQSNQRKKKSTHKSIKGIELKGRTQNMECFCGNEYKARTADLKRGWGMACSKSCAALRKKYGKPAAKLLDKEGEGR